MSGFNLVDESWVPVRYRGEGEQRLVSLREVFAQQQAVEAVVGPSPLATFALYRLLFAIAHRALNGPATPTARRALLADGRVDPEGIDAYLQAWRRRFDLFDPVRPFYQDATAVGKEVGPVSKLCQERAGGNNATLFDHSSDAGGATLTPAEAAVQLLVVQAYSLGGLVSVPEGADASYKSAKAGPLVKTIGVVIGGHDLGTLLARNLVPYMPGKLPFEAAGAAPDLPAWEREESIGVEPRWPAGYLDLLTWQSRRVRLLAEDGQVTGAYVFKGEPLPEAFGLHGRDPALAFRRNRDPKATLGWLPLSFDEARALWRDAQAFARGTDGDADGAPLVLKALADAVAADDGQPVNWPIEAYGLASDQAKALFWRAERFDWPTAYLAGDAYGTDLVAALGRGLAYAEAMARTLGGGSVSLPPREARDKPLDVGAPLRKLLVELGTGSKDVLSRAEGLGAKARYWAALGPAFQRFALHLPTGSDGAGPVAAPEAIKAWNVAVLAAAEAAFESATTAFHHSGRQLRALALARQAFQFQSRALSARYLQNEGVATSDAEEVIA